MKTTFHRHFAILARLGLVLLLGTATAFAIKIDIPEQYQEEVERLRAEEKKELQEEIEQIESGDGAEAGTEAAGEAAAGEEGMRFTGEGAPEDPAPDAEGADAQTAGSGSFLLESVEEAKGAAETYEKDLPENQGLVSGQVVDQETGTPVSGVAILLEGTDVGTITDSDGRYSLGPAPAGQYTLSFVKSGYIEANVTEFQVKPDQVSVFPFALPPRPAEMSDEVYELQDFTVTAQEANELMALIELKQSSVGTMEFLSSEDFDRFIGSDVADFVKRMAGVNIVEGKFAVVRGLGDRYNSTTLNGLPVPSSDPVRQGVQLDLFPTSVVESVTSSKTFLPHLPSNTSGAAFDLITNSYPKGWEFSFKTGVKTNSNAEESLLLNPNFEAPPGTPSGGDYSVDRLLGRDRTDFQDGQYAAEPGPSELLGGQSFSFSAGNTFFDVLGLAEIGFASSMRYSASSKTLLGGQHDKFGRESIPQDSFFIGGTLFTIPARPGSFTIDNPLPVSGLVYDLNQSVVSEDSAFHFGGGVVFDEEENHRLDLAYFRSVVTLSEATRRNNGFLPESINRQSLDRGFASNTRNQLELAADIVGRNYYRNSGGDLFTQGQDFLRHEVRTLESFQVSGSHTFPVVDRDLEVSWGLTEATAKSDSGNPDPSNYVAGESTLLYLQNATGRDVGGSEFAQVNPAITVPAGGFIFGDPQGLAESFVEEVIRSTARSINDEMEGHRADLVFPLMETLDIKGGTFYSKTVRSVRQVDRLFQLGIFASAEDLPGLAEESLTNLSADIDLNSFADVEREMSSEYISVNFSPLDFIEFEGGARFTDVDIFADGTGLLFPQIGLFGPLGVLDAPVEGNPTITNGELLGYEERTPGIIDETFLLPAASLKVTPFKNFDALKNFDVRLAYGKTIALPSARELSPVFTVDSLSGDRVLGNPALKHSEIENRSLGFSYRDDSGRFSAGVNFFQKDITEPIEQIGLVDTISGAAFQSFINNENDATVEGMEIEAQLSLDLLFDNAFFEANGPSSLLKYFTIGGNVSFIEAEVPFPQSVKTTYINQTEGTGGFQVSPYTTLEPGSDAAANLSGKAVFPETRRLFDQPEYTYNVYLSFAHEDLGTSATLSVYGQSDVLTSVGSGSNLALDQYTNPFQEVDLTISQTFGEEKSWKLTFSVENLTDTERGVSYRRSEGSYSTIDGAGQVNFEEVTVDRIRYKVGRTYSLSLSAEF